MSAGPIGLRWTRMFRFGAPARTPIGYVFDVSPHGCKLEFVERPKVDEHVWVKFEGLDSIECLVSRLDGFVVGVEFVRPMHEAVFKSLVARLR
jgi:hypothetical protein